MILFRQNIASENPGMATEHTFFFPGNQSDAWHKRSLLGKAGMNKGQEERMRAIRSGNIFRMIDDANIERMIVQLKSLRISLAHGREMQAMLSERGYERGIHFIAVAMTLVDNIFSINGFELAVAQLDIKSTLTGILTGIIIANTVIRNSDDCGASTTAI